MDNYRFMTFPIEDDLLFKMVNVKELKIINKYVYSRLEFKSKI